MIKKYLENGVGFDCSTSELKDLDRLFKKDKTLLLKNLQFLESYKEKVLNTSVDNSALGVVADDLIMEELDKINGEINLIVITLKYENMTNFLKDKGAL